MAPSSFCDDFEMPRCFSLFLTSQSLSTCHSLHCNMFCGARASPFLRNQLSALCNSAFHCCFCSARRAMHFLVLHNNSVALRPTQAASGLFAAHLLLSYLKLVYLFYRCWEIDACVIYTIDNRMAAWSVWVFTFRGGYKVARSAHFKHSLSLFCTLIIAFLPFQLFLRAVADSVQHSRTQPLFFQEFILIPAMTSSEFVPSLFQQICKILFLYGPHHVC